MSGPATSTVRWGKRADMVVHSSEPFNAEPPASALAGNVLTPMDTFYARNHGAIPHVDPSTWRLTVGGLVGRELSLSLAELRTDYAHQEIVATLQCAGNRRAALLSVRDLPGEEPWGPGATSTARWTGVSLADVLGTAGVGAGAEHVEFAAGDVSPTADPPQAYGGSIDLAKARSREVLLAWGMNGQALPDAHGGPVRVVVPGYIGARSVKWVDRVSVRAQPSDNYFQAVAYRLLPPEADPERSLPGEGLSLGPVALNTAILRPADGARLTAGSTEITGYAFAGDARRVVRVDVSADGGATWRQAFLDEPASAWAWTHWRIRVDLAAGAREILARAWDSTGALQPASPEHVWNPKGYVNNSWARITVHAE
ncbi:MAG: sulfite oxidase [Nocardioidaceae bacterium]